MILSTKSRARSLLEGQDCFGTTSIPVEIPRSYALDVDTLVPLAVQVDGLIGSRGILPAGEFLRTWGNGKFQDPHHIRDLNATLLHQLGIDHHRFTGARRAQYPGVRAVQRHRARIGRAHQRHPAGQTVLSSTTHVSMWRNA